MKLVANDNTNQRENQNRSHSGRLDYVTLNDSVPTLKIFYSACRNWMCQQDFGKCYRCSCDIYSLSWNEAKARCAAIDPNGLATLASVRSQREHDYIVSIGGGGWIGGTDKAAEGVWRWVI